MEMHDIARNQIDLAITEIRSRHRLLGHICARISLLLTPTVDSSMTGFDAGRITMRINPDWAATVPLIELEGVLLHEVNHLLLGHHEIDHIGLNIEILDIAKDLSANEFNDKPAPVGSATLADFPDFPFGESVLERYQRLQQLWDQLSSDLNTPVAESSDSKESEAGSGDSKNSKAERDGSGDASLPALDSGDQESPSDSHSAPPPHDPTLSENSISIAAIMLDAAKRTEDGNLSELEHQLLVHIPDICAFCGSIPGDKSSLIGQVTRATALVPWKCILRRYVGEALPIARPSYLRPPRRFPALLGIVPGRQSPPGTPVILAAIDTSASMTDEVLSEIAHELRFLARRRRVIIAEVDATVHQTYRFTGCIKRLQGRGGTNFNPIFEPTLLRRTHADLVIVFTDGYGPAPEDPPRIPVIWAITTPSAPPATWGVLIRLQTESKT